MKKRKLNALTLAALFAAIYIIMSAFSLAFPFFDAIILVIMPIFATYYAAKYHFKEIILFNLSTILLCFLVTISDPFFSVLYILPTLFVGDIFGLLYQKKIPYFTTYFILSISFLLTNLFSFYLTKVIYEIDLLQQLFHNASFSKYFSLTFLLALSMIESFVCQTLVSNELKKFNLQIFKENTIPLYYFIVLGILIAVCVASLWLWINLYICLFVFIVSLSIFMWMECFKKIKQKTLFAFCILVYLIFSAIPIIAYQQFVYLPCIILLPIAILQIVYLCRIGYNNTRKRKNIKETEE